MDEEDYNMGQDKKDVNLIKNEDTNMHQETQEMQAREGGEIIHDGKRYSKVNDDKVVTSQHYPRPSKYKNPFSNKKNKDEEEF